MPSATQQIIRLLVIALIAALSSACYRPVDSSHTMQPTIAPAAHGDEGASHAEPGEGEAHESEATGTEGHSEAGAEATTEAHSEGTSETHGEEPASNPNQMIVEPIDGESSGGAAIKRDSTYSPATTKQEENVTAEPAHGSEEAEGTATPEAEATATPGT